MSTVAAKWRIAPLCLEASASSMKKNAARRRSAAFSGKAVMSASSIKKTSPRRRSGDVSEKPARAGEAGSAASQLLAEASRQLEALIVGRGEVKLSLVAHKYFMPHLFRALPNTAVNPVHAAARAALEDMLALQASRSRMWEDSQGERGCGKRKASAGDKPAEAQI